MDKNPLLSHILHKFHLFHPNRTLTNSAESVLQEDLVHMTLLPNLLQAYFLPFKKFQAITVQPAPFVKPRCVLIAANVSGLLMNRRLYHPDRLVYAFYPDESNSFDIFYHFHAHLRKNTRLESQLFAPLRLFVRAY